MDIGYCNLIEHEIELEEGAAPHRERAGRMAPRKVEACRAEREFARIRHDRTLEVTLGLWSYHGQKRRIAMTAMLLLQLSLSERSDHKRRLPNTTHRRETLELGDAKFSPHWTWVVLSGRFLCGNRLESKQDSHVN